jgi:hypothetical protein
MEKYFNLATHYLTLVVESTWQQLFVLFGPLLILLVILNFSALLIARLSVRFWGRNIFLYGFVWLGCSVHELSHAFFALLFGHKIKEIALFKPNSDGQSLGHVSHTFNKKSVYQKIGNFFIGISPLLAGGIVLFLTNFILFKINVTTLFTTPIHIGIFTDFNLLRDFLAQSRNLLKDYFHLVFPGSATMWWKSLILIYVLYSTGSSMTLSKSDIRGAFSGLVWLVLFTLIFNLLTLWIGDFSMRSLKASVHYISGFYFILLLSFVANLLFILLFAALNLLKGLFTSPS